MKNERHLEVLRISQELFLHHGFQKVTLADIAKEVGVSRPTLYQLFPNKQEIFNALIVDWQESSLARIEEKLNRDSPAAVQLKTAIDIWIIEPFEMIQASPRAADFQDATFSFAEETIDAGYTKFESVIRSILESESLEVPISTPALAHLIVVSLRGFKTQVKEVKELRKLIRNLIALALSG